MSEQGSDVTAGLDAFEAAYNELKLPLCYNGDINALVFFKTVEKRFPDIGASYSLVLRKA